ncbi:hypothetical protein LAZ67_19001648 [Cordylochernes scorpioides]|uniref:Uncharacterized protein n=1 Tax=Cordylochernes scorpioides TaxID=51811 RepID=A0ABY6LLP1_9ARAC|nr:hypothetical protein LAZ67_19001648 [Cordylochernes scorpioides]
MAGGRRTKLSGVLQESASCCLKRSGCCFPPTLVYFVEDSRRFYQLLSPVVFHCAAVEVQEVAITCSKALNLDKEIIIPASVVSLNHEKRKVWMANRSDFAKIIPAGVKVAEISHYASHLCYINGGNDDFEKNENRWHQGLE